MKPAGAWVPEDYLVSGRRHVLLLASALASAAIVGCSGGTTTIIHSPATSPATGPASPSAASTTPSSDDDALKEEATECVDKIGTRALQTPIGRRGLAECVENYGKLDHDISDDDDDSFENCLTSAAAADKVWTSEGRAKFTQTSVHDCLNQASHGDDDNGDDDDDDG